MHKLEFLAIALVILFMVVAVAGKVKMDVFDGRGNAGQEANPVVPYNEVRD